MSGQNERRGIKKKYAAVMWSNDWMQGLVLQADGILSEAEISLRCNICRRRDLLEIRGAVNWPVHLFPL